MMTKHSFLSRTTIVSLGLAISLAAATAWGQSPAEDERFDSFLRSIDVTANAATIEQTWPDARQRLMTAAADAERDTYTRVRAASLLGNFQEKEVRAFLVELTGDPEVEVRRIAYYTVGRVFGGGADDALLAVLRRGINDPVADVRDHAIRSLRWVEHADVEGLLEALAKTHTDEGVRKLAARTLERRQR